MNDVFSRAVVRDSEGRVVVPNQPLAPVLVYVCGSAVGGAASGAVLGTLGLLLGRFEDEIWPRTIVTVALLALALQVLGRTRPLPERRKQVPRRWLLWPSRSHTAVVFGLMIGAGFFTYLQHASAYVLAGLAVMTGSTAAAAVLGGVYGMFRALPLVVTWAHDACGADRPKWQLLLSYRLQVNLSLGVVAATCFAIATAVHPVV